MEPIRGSVCRLASLIALGCLLGAATAAIAAGTTFVSAAPASADISCGYSHANVEGGRSSYHYGASGLLYSSPFVYSPTMAFDTGQPIGNSAR